MPLMQIQYSVRCNSGISGVIYRLRLPESELNAKFKREKLYETAGGFSSEI